MEKYARQALAEGIQNAEDITVTSESEIYRVLNLHYNRNNQIEVRFLQINSPPSCSQHRTLPDKFWQE